MDLERPQLYFFLLPFTVVTIFLTAQILLEFRRNRDKYDEFFYGMIASQSLYDVSYVIVYFTFEIPQDWPILHPFLFRMNGTIIPQVAYAHSYLCMSAECLGVVILAFSRMMKVCYFTSSITSFLSNFGVKRILVCHFALPAIFAGYVLFGEDWRTYIFVHNNTRLTRNGSTESIAMNSYIMCFVSFFGAILSSLFYLRMFVELRTRTIGWRSELSTLFTSFVLFCALCTLTGYNIFCVSVIGQDMHTYYRVMKHFYAFSFFISLVNPWCIFISSGRMRSSILRRSLPSCFLDVVRRPSHTPEEPEHEPEALATPPSTRHIDTTLQSK